MKQVNAHGPGGAQDTMSCAGMSRQFRFKRFRFPAQNILAGMEWVQHRVLNFGVDQTPRERNDHRRIRCVTHEPERRHSCWR